MEPLDADGRAQIDEALHQWRQGDCVLGEQWDQPTFEKQGWHVLLQAWLKRIPVRGRFGQVGGAVLTLDDLTARDYVESDPLDIDHLSSRDE